MSFMVPHGLLMNIFDWNVLALHTLPIPLMVFLFGMGTVAWQLLRLDPISIIERRDLDAQRSGSRARLPDRRERRPRRRYRFAIRRARQLRGADRPVGIGEELADVSPLRPEAADARVSGLRRP